MKEETPAQVEQKIERLKEVLSIQSATRKNEMMMAFIVSKLKEIKGVSWFMKKGNLYAIKGTTALYPCVVSHTDTVHDIHVQYGIVENNGHLMAFSDHNQVGTGGDDKVGVFACLELLRDLKVVKAAFFRDEESGCQGSRVHHKKFFYDVGYVLQADRQGNKGITETISGTEMIGDSFKSGIKDLMTKYNREYVNGMMTDVQELARSHKISMCNIECGYYIPHTDYEYVVIKDVLDTLNFMKEIILKLGRKNYVCDHVFKGYGYSAYGSSYAGYGSYGGHSTYYNKKTGTPTVYNKAVTHMWDDEGFKQAKKDNYDGWIFKNGAWIRKEDSIKSVGTVIQNLDNYTQDEIDALINNRIDDHLKKKCKHCNSAEIDKDELSGDVFCYSCGEWELNDRREEANESEADYI